MLRNDAEGDSSSTSRDGRSDFMMETLLLENIWCFSVISIIIIVVEATTISRDKLEVSGAQLKLFSEILPPLTEYITAQNGDL